MRVRLARGPRQAVAVATWLLICLGCLAGCAADRAASDPTKMSRLHVGPADSTVRVLQMNLCNSGRADCYSGGRAVSMAVTLIHQDRPDMVSVNEVCRDDVHVLERAMSAAVPAATVAAAFTPARLRPTQAPVRCQNGQRFGDGVLVVVSSHRDGVRRYSGVYPAQDLRDPEERVWACVDPATRFIACTTHTDSASTTIALEQCRHLLNTVVPMISRRDGGPIILGADLNLAARGSPSAQSCLPSGYQRADDQALQDVVVSPGMTLRSHSAIDMHGTTDHPGLLVEVVLSRR